MSRCDLLPEAAPAPVAQVQRPRDPVIADSLIRVANGAVLIGGCGDSRAKHWCLRDRQGAPDVVWIRFAEVRPGARDWLA